jgi:phosphoserine phosphatase
MVADDVLAVGDGEPDVCMLAAAGTSVAFQPKSAEVSNAAHHILSDNLLEILTIARCSASPQLRLRAS